MQTFYICAKVIRKFYAIPNMKPLPDIASLHAPIQLIEEKLPGGVSLSILRLDMIHPQISGNKFFKLYYYLQQALGVIPGTLPIAKIKPGSPPKRIITFGGAYSNHLYATAAACNYLGIPCTGVVRGEASSTLSHTLLFCISNGIQLEFISREKYDSGPADEFKKQLHEKYGHHILVPEGGFGPMGVKGAELITGLYKDKGFSHICCAAGTATTLAGLISTAGPHQEITGFSILNQPDDLEERIRFLIGEGFSNYSLVSAYNFGGYAKKNDALTAFMKRFYMKHKIPTDIVYTAKMMYGVMDLINKNYFPPGSRILCLHTGGLQGNDSLPKGTLNF
jgi:1-aminocyclopropane-1-carboxylate deaminase/D-cysteine desulfhydrase-like pyridoxal-dependent ACC family enzyme